MENEMFGKCLYRKYVFKCFPCPPHLLPVPSLATLTCQSASNSLREIFKKNQVNFLCFYTTKVMSST